MIERVTVLRMNEPIGHLEQKQMYLGRELLGIWDPCKGGWPLSIGFSRILAVFSKNGPSLPLFLYFCLFNTQLTVHKQMFNMNKFLPMTGFELQTSCIRINHSTNWATTTARFLAVIVERPHDEGPPDVGYGERSVRIESQWGRIGFKIISSPALVDQWNWLWIQTKDLSMAPQPLPNNTIILSFTI